MGYKNRIAEGVNKISGWVRKFFSDWRNYTLAACFLGMLCMDRCRQSETEYKQSVIDSLTLASQKSDSMLNQAGDEVFMQQVLVTQKQGEIKKLTDSVFNLKKKYEKKIKNVIAYYSEKTVTRIDSVKVPFVDTAAVKQWEDSITAKCADVIAYYESQYIPVPRQAEDSTEFYSVNITTTREGNIINSLQIPDVQSIRIVELKGGLLKKGQDHKLKLWLKKSFQVQVLHSNPLIHINGQNSVIYIPQKKGGLVWKIVSFAAGAYIGTKL